MRQITLTNEKAKEIETLALRLIEINNNGKDFLAETIDLLTRLYGNAVEIESRPVNPTLSHHPIQNNTCRLCTRREACPPYNIVGYILHTDPRFRDSPDHDDLFLHLGELCDKINIEEGQRG